MSQLIDCRGLSCPQPVLRTKEVLDGASEPLVTVLVDNIAAKENVRRFAESRGAAVTVLEEGGYWRLDLLADRLACAAAEGLIRAEDGGSVMLVVSDQIGPEPELGRILMRALLGTLSNATKRPSKLLFVNRGVHLTTEGSEVADVLRELENAGMEVFSCGTCLDFFGKREALIVGRVSNMYDTVETLTGPAKVVTVG